LKLQDKHVENKGHTLLTTKNTHKANNFGEISPNPIQWQTCGSNKKLRKLLRHSIAQFYSIQ